MTDEQRIEEAYDERAAIMHFCGGLPIEKAEALALAEAETYRQSLKTRKIDDSVVGQG